MPGPRRRSSAPKRSSRPAASHPVPVGHSKVPPRTHGPLAGRTLDARSDTPDLRDLLYVPNLVDVPREITLESYRRANVPILDQKAEGACTGFGLATVVNYLLRTRRHVRDGVPVSPHMLYRMARRYDEWPGEDDKGSSARGAMKGWHKHGVCALKVWPAAGHGTSNTLLTPDRARDALDRPLGAYFRVNHRDLVAMHAALAEVGILYATSCTHAGWDGVGDDGRISYEPGAPDLGGHAFAIVAYDRTGFWIQNSWGASWGRNGFCHVSYEDWLTNGTDVWVARLGAPVAAAAAFEAAEGGRSGAGAKTPLDTVLLRPHVIGIGNDGVLRKSGVLGTDEAAVDEIFRAGGDFDKRTAGWRVPRLLVYAHGGLNDEEGALQRVQNYRETLLAAEVYPVAFIWKTDYWTTITNALEDAKRKRRPEGFVEGAKDFLFDRLDDALEPVARAATGKLEWDEMKENAVLASTRAGGGARYAARRIADLVRRNPKVEIHVVGHSAGSILHGPLVRLLTEKGALTPMSSWNGVAFEKEADGSDARGEGLTVKTVTMWAPACTMDLFKECYAPGIQSGAIGSFALFTLTDHAEQDDDCGGIYHKSLLYLVSHAFEKTPRIPMMGERFAGEPILGMQWWVDRMRKKDRAVDQAFRKLDWILSPNQNPDGSTDASTSLHHGAFDDDGPTLRSTLARILGPKSARVAARAKFNFRPSARKLEDCRRSFEEDRRY